MANQDYSFGLADFRANILSLAESFGKGGEHGGLDRGLDFKGGYSESKFRKGKSEERGEGKERLLGGGKERRKKKKEKKEVEERGKKGIEETQTRNSKKREETEK